MYPKNGSRSLFCLMLVFLDAISADDPPPSYSEVCGDPNLGIGLFRSSLGVYQIHDSDAEEACATVGRRLCSYSELSNYQQNGGNCCACGWLDDGLMYYPMQEYNGTGCCSNKVCECGVGIGDVWCCTDFIYESDNWNLVRRVSANAEGWHETTDNLDGTAALYGMYSSDPTSDTSFGVAFADLDFDYFKIATGDGVHWVIFSRDALVQAKSEGCAGQLKLLASDNSEIPYNVEICHRSLAQEDPWISSRSHSFGDATASSDTEEHSMLYGENGQTGWSFWRQNHGGANVFIRKGAPLFEWSFPVSGETYTDESNQLSFSTDGGHPLIVPSLPELPGHGEDLLFQDFGSRSICLDAAEKWISDPSLTNSILSFSFWTKIQGGRYILSSGGQTSSRGFYFIRTDTQYDEFSNGIGVGVKDGTRSWSIMYPKCVDVEAEWTHYAVTLDGVKLRLYKNGELLAATYSMEGEVDDVYTELCVAQPNNVDDFYGFFELDDLRFYNYVLSDEDVRTSAVL